LTTHPTPTHLGVDDWAFCRNVSYGTILVDLQDHQIVDLLPDRSASSLESWLKSHPGFNSSAVIDLVTMPQEPAIGSFHEMCG
jgi:transposase